mmetsp:Transcript_42060/g.61883  ORF Transcript_42060/g.61883 Transcript_42060/m.61883 type:complete len:302 (-) Transcript_42060:45-950(-)
MTLKTGLIITFSALAVLSSPSAAFQTRHQAHLQKAQAFQNLVSAPIHRAQSRVSLSGSSQYKTRLAAGSIPDGGKRVFDAKAFATYIGATGAQMGFISAFMYGLNFLLSKVSGYPLLQTVVISVFFAIMSLKSRIFSPLDNSRPSPESQTQRNKEMKRPSWMPPPLAFPIIWSTIGILRTVSSVLVWKAMGRDLLNPATLALMLHLSIGDTWNTINNVDRRLGFAVPGVVCVWLSVLNLVRAYFAALPLAGYVIAPSALWLSVAMVLVTTLWRMNSNGQEPLWPYKVVAPEKKNDDTLCVM